MLVHFYATLRSVVGQREVEILLPDGAPVRQLVSEIVTQYPALRREMVDKRGNLQSHIHIFVNGRDITHLENQIDTRLSSGDVISIFPPVGGG
jgi:molybdopterin synthase sulfur carrier subunit